MLGDSLIVSAGRRSATRTRVRLFVSRFLDGTIVAPTTTAFPVPARKQGGE